MTYEPMYESTNDIVFEVVEKDLEEQRDFYPDAQRMIPRHMSQALGKYVVIKYDVYANN